MQFKDKCGKIINDFKPDIVIGAGGYITAPVIYAAHKCKVPTLIHEQNSIPGLSNKLVGSFADRICVSLPNSVNLFPKDKVCYTGNPRSEEIVISKPISKKELGFDMNKISVTVFGNVTFVNIVKFVAPSTRAASYIVLEIVSK